MTSILVERDTAPTITGTITHKSTGAAVDLTAAIVYFQLREVASRKFRVDAECTITDAVNGEVSYDLTEDDLNFDGNCYARFLVIYADDRRQHTVPQLEIEVQSQ